MIMPRKKVTEETKEVSTKTPRGTKASDAKKEPKKEENVPKIPRKRSGRKRSVEALTLVYDEERYKKDDRTKSLHEEIDQKELERKIEDGETAYNDISYVAGLEQQDIDYIRESIEKKETTPSQYFNFLKNLKGKIQDETVSSAIAATQNLIRTCVVTGQKTLAENLMVKLELLLRERNAIVHGYDTVINRVDLEAWTLDIYEKAKKEDKPNPIHIIELKNYSRTIPEDVIEKVGNARNYFDMLYVAYTDYTGETVRKVEKEKRDKDPIIFGAFLVPTEHGNRIPSEHLFYIADWIDDFCDLTMDQVIKSYKEATNKDIVLKKEDISSIDIDKIKEQIKAM